MENYFTSQRDHIFRNVEVLIYVFDVESRDIEKDLQYYQTCLEAMAANSQGAKVFTLIHKMDLVQEDLRDQIFAERVQELRARSHPMQIEAFRTSIWDETLYQAWSSIVYTLVPNVSLLETHLGRFASLCEAEEVVLFERTTFLVISHTAPPDSHRRHPDLHRFEKISNIIKQFKQSCTKSQVQFKSMEFRHPTFTAFVDVLTPNTYVLLVMADPSIQSAATLMNIRMARAHFEKLEANQLR
ncbi:GTP-binding protein gtr1 [Entomophthora muscae]|uniref:GTP-binding protein gtr1 n=1 Tax=Entomophthora muscae TaxID=34485 RepID=A0ACC2TGV7_9FUNG|nr:GTP-binding protein gtr1 [Entomophthora muscae]